MILQSEGGVKGRSKCIYSFSFRERKVQLSVSNDYPERTLFREGWRLCLEYPSSCFVGLFVCLSVLQFSRKRLDIRSRNFASKLHM